MSEPIVMFQMIAEVGKTPANSLQSPPEQKMLVRKVSHKFGWEERDVERNMPKALRELARRILTAAEDMEISQHIRL